jgi:hypothetical protein
VGLNPTYKVSESISEYFSKVIFVSNQLKRNNTDNWRCGDYRENNLLEEEEDHCKIKKEITKKQFSWFLFSKTVFKGLITK